MRVGKAGRGSENKKVVFGMLERDGDVMTRVVPKAQAKVLVPIIRENVRDGNTISSDGALSYKSLPRYGFKHGAANHSAEEWCAGLITRTALKVFGRC